MKTYPSWINPIFHDLWDVLPEYMHGEIDRFVAHGIRPGSFLYHALCNDFAGAVRYADIANRHLFIEYIQFFTGAIPSQSWGSCQKVDEWIRAGDNEGHTMTPAELREARHQLGLTQKQMAHMLDIRERYYQMLEAAPDVLTAMPVPARVKRLITAYMSGYRPEDWPG